MAEKARLHPLKAYDEGGEGWDICREGSTQQSHTISFLFFHSVISFLLSKAVVVATQTRQRHIVAAVVKIVEHIASNSADRSKNPDA